MLWWTATNHCQCCKLWTSARLVFPSSGAMKLLFFFCHAWWCLSHKSYSSFTEYSFCCGTLIWPGQIITSSRIFVGWTNDWAHCWKTLKFSLWKAGTNDGSSQKHSVCVNKMWKPYHLFQAQNPSSGISPQILKRLEELEQENKDLRKGELFSSITE